MTLEDKHCAYRHTVKGRTSGKYPKDTLRGVLSDSASLSSQLHRLRNRFSARDFRFGHQFGVTKGLSSGGSWSPNWALFDVIMKNGPIERK